MSDRASSAMISSQTAIAAPSGHSRGAYPVTPAPKSEVIHAMLDAAEKFDH